MFRTHTCGELRLANTGTKVTLAGWVARTRDKGFVLWIDLRDRYGITQVMLSQQSHTEALLTLAKSVGREWVLQIEGTVIERESKNNNIPTGDIEILAENIVVLNNAKTPPFTIENETDGGEDLRMQYRYLDIRREPVRDKLILRHKVAQLVRAFLSSKDFIEVETPVLIKSTPEGARDFVVPSRLNANQWYALPQSPQTFKQLLMVGGLDKYFQIVKCFRDEDLRADRQPEFTQIDCELSFVEREDILAIFEEMVCQIFKDLKGVDLGVLSKMTYNTAMHSYGSDKPDIRFDLLFTYYTDLVKGKDFAIFDNAKAVIGFTVPGGAAFTRKQIDELTEWIKRPQIGAQGLVYCRYNEDGTLKSSVDKFYSQTDLQTWASLGNAKPGDLMVLLCGNEDKTQKQLGELRLYIGDLLGLRDNATYKALWVVDFPLLEKDEELNRWHAMHHPFTSPLAEDIELMQTNPGKVRANAYDLVINGVEVGGGSIRIFNKELQQRMFELLGFTPEEAQAQFGFLLNAFEYGAPPHGGIALGFDRLCSLIGGTHSIKDYIAFPKNNAGRDVMIDAPSPISKEQLKELGLI